VTKAPGSPGYRPVAETPRCRRGRKEWIPTEASVKRSTALAFAPS